MDSGRVSCLLCAFVSVARAWRVAVLSRPLIRPVPSPFLMNRCPAQASLMRVSLDCRSNGFEQKRFARLASKKAFEELAYKWSVEDM